MGNNNKKHTANPGDSIGGLWLRGIARVVIIGLLIGGALFFGAGTFDWFSGWFFLGVFTLSIMFNLFILLKKTPDLMRERWKRKSDTKPFDKVFGLFYMLSTLSMFLLSGMDSVRYEWTQMDRSLTYAGLGLHILGTIPILWSMLSNPHLETTVRIQNDRGHKVITEGPYRYVRHPMYVGVSLMFIGWGFLLGSWVAVGVAVWIILLLIIRTALEDRTLQMELEGYKEFCQKTRYRLVPGIW